MFLGGSKRNTEKKTIFSKLTEMFLRPCQTGLELFERKRPCWNFFNENSNTLKI